MSVPLEYGGELIGVINVSDCHNKSSFSSHDLKLLLDLCGFFAFFVYQSRRFYLDENESNSKPSLPPNLATGLIHELNNPLDGIIRYVNLSLNTLGEEHVAKEYLSEAKKGLSRIVKIIRSLLDFRRSNSFVTSSIDINKALDEAIFLLKHNCLSGRIKIIRNYNQALPIFKDYGLKLVFSNLLKNASDAIGNNQGTIEVVTEKREAFLDIRFSDTGPGISEALRNKIFEPFFTTKEMGKGSGLGLAICLNIVEKYKGCIILENAKEKGAVFTVRIPLNGS